MAGSSGNKTNSAFNWVEVEVEAELGNKGNCKIIFHNLEGQTEKKYCETRLGLQCQTPVY